MRFIFYLGFIFLSSCSLILNFRDLPEPQGQYIIGTDIFTWEDSYRDEWFTKDKIDTRKIVEQIWYPASEKSDSLYPYMDYADLRVESISERIGKGKGTIKPVTKVKTNTRNNCRKTNTFRRNTKEAMPLHNYRFWGALPNYH